MSTVAIPFIPPASQRRDADPIRSGKAISTLQIGMAWFAEQPGGLDRYFAHLLTELDRAGAPTYGLVAGSSRVEQDSHGLVRAFASPGDSILRRWQGLRSQFDAARLDFQPDLITSHFALYAFPLLSRLRQLTHVVHFHGPWAMECRAEGERGVVNMLKMQLERRVYRSADLCIVLSQAFARVLVEQYGVAEERVRVIPGGVECARFATSVPRIAARQQFGWPVDRPILLTVRRLVPRMGLEHLIDAVAALRRDHPDLLLLIAGRGPMAGRLQARIEQAGLQDHVRLVGFIADEQLPLALRAADCTIVPSAALEGFGLSAVESLAAGTPCLVTPVGGLPEVVRDLDPALIFDRADAQAMTDRIADVLKTPALLPSEARCTEFAGRYDWSIIASRVADVYREAMSSSR